MSKNLTQEEAEQKSLDVGIKMIGQYVNTRTKIKFECHYCQKIFVCNPNSIWQQHTKSCGCIQTITQVQAEQKGLDVGIKMVGKYINCDTKTEFECPYCKKIFLTTPYSIWSKNTQSCGCILGLKKILTQQQAEQKSLNVGVKMIGQYIGAQTKTKFECPFCQKIFVCKPCKIWQKHTQSCGNCNTTRNGQNTSYKSLSLQKLLPICAQHNYYYDKPKSRKCVDWAFVYKAKKIVLEYDEYYYHGHKQKEDNKRYQQLIRKGWKVIQIKAHNNIPTQEQINSALSKIENGRKKVTITLSGWNSGPTIADRHNKLKVA
jgi:hypothetical protein